MDVGWTNFHLMGFKLFKNLYLVASTKKFIKKRQTKVEIIIADPVIRYSEYNCFNECYYSPLDC